MRALFGKSDEVAAFVAARIPGCERGFGECQAIGFLNAKWELEAGVVYHNWNPESEVIEVSSASSHRRWATRDRIRLIFDYPFHQIGCQMVVARTDPANLPAMHIWRAFGAREYVIPRLRGRNTAEVITTLTVEDWSMSKFAKKVAVHGKA